MPCKRRSLSLLCVAAAILVVAGCSPFKTKVRRDVAVRAASHTPEAIPSAVRQAAAPRGTDFPARTPARTSTPADSNLDEKAVQLLTLGRLTERQGQTDQAEQLFRRLIEIAPEHPDAYHRLAIIQSKAGNFAAAEQLFSKAYKLAPKDAELATDIGYFYYLSSKPKHAEQFLRYALELDRNSKAACNNLALLLGEQGRDDEARAFFQRAGTEAEATANMAFLYAQRGQLDLASKTYSRALTLDNTMRPAAEALLKIARHQEQHPVETIDVPPPRARHSATNQGRPVAEVADAPWTRATRPDAIPRVGRSASTDNPGPATATAASLSVGDLTQREPQGPTVAEVQTEPAGTNSKAEGSSTTGALFSWLTGGRERPTQPADDPAAMPTVDRLRTEMHAPRIGSGVAGDAREREAPAAETSTRQPVSMRISDDADATDSGASLPAETGQTRHEAAAKSQDLPPAFVAEHRQPTGSVGARKPRQGEVIEVSSPTKCRPASGTGVEPAQRPVTAVFTTATDKAGTDSLQPCSATAPATKTTAETTQQTSSRRVHRQPQTDAPAADLKTRAPSNAMRQRLNGPPQSPQSSRRTTSYPEG